MIVQHTCLPDHQHSAPGLSERGRPITLLQIETQDSLHTILDVLHQQDRPTLLLLPASGTPFHQPDHFLALRSLLIEGRRPPFCLVIPSHLSKEAAFATHYGIEHASSLEAALRSLAHSAPSEETPSSPMMRPRSAPLAPTRWQTLRSFLPHPRSLRSRAIPPSLLPGAVVLVLLLLASIAVLPLLLLPTHSATARPATPATPAGTLSFTSSQQFDPATTRGYNDLLTLSLRSLAAPPAGMKYEAWLMPDPQDHRTPPLLLGALQSGGPIHFPYRAPDHRNLLASYSGVSITLQPDQDPPAPPGQHPATTQFQGFLPNIATPGDEHQYSLLSHLRHLLAQDPTLQANQIPGGLDIWLTRNVAKVEEWASAAQGDWHGPQTSDGQATQIHRQLLRILQYLDGAFYYARDVPAGSPWLVDPQAGKIGLLDRVHNQNPPGYLAHVAIHLIGLAGSPGHSAQQQQLALLINRVISQMRTDLLQVRTDASTLVHLNTQQLRQPGNEALLDDLATQTTTVTSGWLDPNTGENIGGTVWIFSRLQQLAALPIYPLSDGRAPVSSS